MLRISKKERQALYSTNARIRRKMKNLKTTYNITADFNVKTPRQFTTRAELNAYKEATRDYLNPYNHRYIKGGLKRPDYKYYYAIPYEEYMDVKRHLVKQQRVAKRLMAKADKIPYQVRGKMQDESTGDVLRRMRKNVKLGSRLQQFFPIKLQTSKITSQGTWNKFSGAIMRFNTKQYYERKSSIAKQNMISALYNTFGSNAEPIVALLQTFTNEEFSLLFESEDYVDFDYVYSPEHAFDLLQNMASGILRFIASSSMYTKKKYERTEFLDEINNLRELTNIDSASILSEYNTHEAVFRYNGQRYYGIFRTSEIAEIEQGINLDKYASRKSNLKMGEYENVKDVRKRYGRY